MSSIDRPVLTRATTRLIGATSGAQIYIALSTFVTTALTARYLGPEGRGIYVATVSWVMAFATLGYLSLSQVIVYVAAAKVEEDWLQRVAGTLAAIVTSVSILLWTAAYVLYALRGDTWFPHIAPTLMLLAFLQLPLWMWTENAGGILISAGRVDFYNFARVTSSTVTPVLIVLLVVVGSGGVEGALLALVVSQAIAAVMTFGWVARHSGGLRYDGKAAKQLLSGGAKLHLNAVGTYLFTQANIIVLNAYRSPTEIAYYQVAVQFLAATQLIPSAAATAAYSLIVRDGPDGVWPTHKKILGNMLMIVATMAAIGYVVSPWAIRLLFGAAFAPAIPLFRILLLAAFGMTFSTVMAPQWIARGLFSEAAALTLVIGASTVAANVFFVPRWGATGAAWVMVGTYTISVAGNGAMALWVQMHWRRTLAGSPV